MTKTQESVLSVLARIVKFLDVDLIRTISDGRAVLEPNKDWAVARDRIAELRSLSFLLTDRQNAIIDSIIDHLQLDLNAIFEFFRELPAKRTTAAEPDLLKSINQLLAQTRSNLLHGIESLGSTFDNGSEFLVPALISESLDRFRRDYPNPGLAGFVMMRFGSTRLHRMILKAIRTSLAGHQMVALRADDRQYHDDLFGNVLTYLHGCAFGIAVFERIERDEFNSNVTLEVGYMAALGKPVLLLKDKTLTILPTDLMGRLYRSFDPLRPGASIPKQLAGWLADKDLIKIPQPSLV